jgi:diguanylate cyclase (GGDEF)-like protein/PAS domain S-box-containing protein
MLALLRGKPQWRRLIGVLLISLGFYSLSHHLLGPEADSDLSWLPSHALLSPLPALLVVIAGLCYQMPPTSTHTWRFYRMAGWLSVGIGAMTLTYPLMTEVPLTPLAEITSLGSVFCLLLGAGLLIIGRQKMAPALSLPRTAIINGVLGVTASIAVWLVSGWVLYSARVDAADQLLSNIADGMEQRVETKVRLIERLAARWQALSGQYEKATQQLWQVETHTYLKDEPSLQALAYRGPQDKNHWHAGREPSDLLWLMGQQTDPATLNWLHQQGEPGTHVNWRFPDSQRDSLGLLAVTLEDANTMLAVIDFAEIVASQRQLDTGSFSITFISQGNTWGTLTAKDWEEGIDQRVIASRAWTLPGGPGITLKAMAGPPSITSLPGALPVIFGLLGLIFSYQLMIGRALVAVRDQQSAALARSEQRFRSLFTQHPDAVFVHTRYGVYESLNPVTETIVGTSQQHLIGSHFRSVVREPICSKEDVERTEIAFQRAISGFPSSYTMRLAAEGRPPKDLEVTLIPSVINGEVDGVFSIAKDITARVAAEERLHILERSLEASSNGTVIVDVREDHLPVIYVNPAFTRITGYLAQDVIGRFPVFLNGDESDANHNEQIHAAIRDGTSLSSTFRGYRRDGSPYWNQLFLSPVRDASQTITHVICIINDISESKQQEHELAYQATHDALTGLGNRVLFNDRLAHDIELAARNGQTLAVLFIDLDEFKPINDTLGHKIGDQVLINISDRLRQGLRASDTLVRLGGDEFVMLLPNLNHSAEAETVASRILGDLNKPHRVSGHELHVSASIGIAMNSGELDEPERLLRHADMAMYKAKQQGRNNYQLFTEDLDRKLNERVTLRSDLQEAIVHGHLRLYYQPLLDRQGNVDGLEALVRWFHPTKGLISPATFIPIAEETGQIIPLSHWIKRQACQDARQLLNQGLLKGRMAINLSPIQFHQPHFLSSLQGALDEAGLPPEHLELELTEGILMHDTKGAITILDALSCMGISTAIDDFGTGFSSLSYLRDLPIDKIKIDRSFVQNAIKSDKNAAICHGVITLAQELDLKIVAEGIETTEQHDYLMSLGCEVFQGFLLAKPMPLENLTTWLTRRAQVSSNA